MLRVFVCSLEMEGIVTPNLVSFHYKDTIKKVIVKIITTIMSLLIASRQVKQITLKTVPVYSLLKQFLFKQTDVSI